MDNDSDDDSIEDGTEDANHNGRIDGDNGDNIFSITETWYETNPCEPDSDGDGFNDGWELDKGYNPRTTDTDEDNIADNDEDKNGNGYRDGDESDATLKDTDGDGLNDQLEVMGWTVIIYREATMEKIDDYTVSCDPNDIDSDDDSITDYGEFQNQTDPNKNDTDGDGFFDIDEIQNGTLPYGIEGIPPTITYFDTGYALRTKCSGLKLSTEVILKVWVDFEDNYYLDYVNVHVKGVGRKGEHTGWTNQSSHYFEWELSYEKAISAIFNSFCINVSAKDKNSNAGIIEVESKSISEFVVGEILEGMDKIFGEIDYIKNLIKNLFINILVTFYQSLFDLIDIRSNNEGNNQILTSNDDEKYWKYSCNDMRDKGIPFIVSSNVNSMFGGPSLQSIMNGHLSTNKILWEKAKDGDLNFAWYVCEGIRMGFHFNQNIVNMFKYYLDPNAWYFYLVTIMDGLGFRAPMNIYYKLVGYPHYLQYGHEGGCALTCIQQSYDWFHGMKFLNMPITVWGISERTGFSVQDMQNGLKPGEQVEILTSLGICEGGYSISEISFIDIRDQIGRERDPVIVSVDYWPIRMDHAITFIGYLDIGIKFLYYIDTNIPTITGVCVYSYFDIVCDNGSNAIRFTEGNA